MLTVIGEAIIDLVQDPDGRYTAHPGGSPLNVAVGLARLGADVAMMARFSTSPFGRRLRAHAAASGVKLDWAVDTDEPATVAVVSLAEDQSAEYAFYVAATADWQWTSAELRIPADTAILHSGSLACFLEPGAEQVANTMRRARSAGVLVSFDPNVRPDLLGSASDAGSRVEELVASADVVKASDQDLAWLYPSLTPAEVGERWLGLGARLVVVTRGPEGAFAMTPEWTQHRPAPAVAVVDTVGAGDAFTAGMLAAMAAADIRSAKALDGLGSAAATPILDEAITAAAITCTRAGANPPTRSELELGIRPEMRHPSTAPSSM